MASRNEEWFLGPVPKPLWEPSLHKLQTESPPHTSHGVPTGVLQNRLQEVFFLPQDPCGLECPPRGSRRSSYPELLPEPSLKVSRRLPAYM
ncbi:hypothetical protein ACOMHN_017696 [Nucella lapillus]